MDGNDFNRQRLLPRLLVAFSCFALSCGGGGGTTAEQPQPLAPSATVLPGACPSGTGSFPNTTCVVLRTQGGGNLDLDVELRIIEPPTSVTLTGTVMLSTGGLGDVFYSDTTGGDLLIADLLAAGQRVVDRRWEGGWYTTGEGVKQQSVRYATLLSWVHDNVHTTGTFCAVGNSAGASEISYALTTWNLGTILDRVVLASGPPFSRLDYSCELPSTMEWLDICTTIVPVGVLECGVSNCSTEMQALCAQLSANPQVGDLESNSVLHPGALLDFPTTDVIFLFGALDCTNAVPLGLFFFNAVTSGASMAFISGTPHLLNSTPDGRTAIFDALFGVLPAPAPLPSMQLEEHYSYSFSKSGQSGTLESFVYDPVTNSVSRQVVHFEQL